MKLFTLLTLIFIFNPTLAQKHTKILTSDIDNFWVAYDSIQTTEDFTEKLTFINKLYIENGTKGLALFTDLRDYNDTMFVKLIEDYPRFWNSVRPNTLSVKEKTQELINAVERFEELYSDLKDAEMFFTIGGLRSGGTVAEDMVLVGAEIATADAATDVSEFQNDWLKNVFASQSLDNVVHLNIHEYVHTQQKSNESNLLLHQVIREGACDFIAELVLNEPLQSSYMKYGRKHFAELKQRFKEEMFSSSYSNWLYNGADQKVTADLGYFMGYEICKAYYDRASDKRKAIKKIIELDYNNENEVDSFLSESGFYSSGFDKGRLKEAYNKKRPVIIGIEPFTNGIINVDPKTTELLINFSSEMNPAFYSLHYSEKGKKVYPINKLIGFENNNQSLRLSMSLEHDKEYEFIINCDGFSSKDGYPLKGGEYLVRFKTN